MEVPGLVQIEHGATVGAGRLLDAGHLLMCLHVQVKTHLAMPDKHTKQLIIQRRIRSEQSYYATIAF